MSGAAVPKATVHKDGDFLSAEDEIRPSRQRRPASPTGDPMLAHQLHEPQFRRAVSARVNPGHPLRARGGSERIHHGYFIGEYFLKCSAMAALICATLFLFGVFSSEVAQGRPG